MLQNICSVKWTAANAYKIYRNRLFKNVGNAGIIKNGVGAVGNVEIFNNTVLPTYPHLYKN